MQNIKDFNFGKNDWVHFHDVILDVTWNNGKLNLTQEQMEILFWELPEELRLDAIKWGMNDTPWRDELWRWYKNNKLNDILLQPKGIEVLRIQNKTTQLSALSDYELELEKLVDKIKLESSTLKCIKLLYSEIDDKLNLIVKELFSKLTDEDRYDIISDYCKYCGSSDTGCQCWNDEQKIF